MYISMYVFVYVCMYVCVYIYICIYTYLYTHVCERVCVYVYAHESMFVQTTCVYSREMTRNDAFSRYLISVSVRDYACACEDICTFLCTYLYISRTCVCVSLTTHTAGANKGPLAEPRTPHLACPTPAWCLQQCNFGSGEGGGGRRTLRRGRGWRGGALEKPFRDIL